MEKPGFCICGKYKIVKKIGAGSFGEVYEGINSENDTPVAIKLESVSAKVPQLLQEARIIKLCEGSGIPRVYYHGTEGRHNVMVMDLLGPTLIQCLKRQTAGFSLKTALQIGLSMLQRIDYVHSRNFIHRDIKPENYVIGKEKKSHLIYLIDFGLAKRYRDSKSHQHIPFRENKSLTGTARYASINNHMGLENSRRDDLESICYVMIYLLKKTLPWQGIAGMTKQEKYRRIMDYKMNTKIDMICKECPPEFKMLLTYSRALRFEEKPDYEYMKGLLSAAAEREKIRMNNVYDWIASRASVSGGTYNPRLTTRRKRTHSIRGQDKRSSSQAVCRTSVIVTVAGDNDSVSSDKCSVITTNKIDLPQFQNRASIMDRRLTFNTEILIRKNIHTSPKCKLF